MTSDPPAARAVVLCADDYGMNRGVDGAILDLAAAGRISATSCMTNAPRWREAASALHGVGREIGLGLHLTLTWGAPLGPMPRLAPGGTLPALAHLVRLAITGRLPEREIAAEIARQVEEFRRALGRDPDFVDGHQHVHALPGVRHLLLEELSARDLAGKAWIRDPSDRVPSIARRGVAAGKAMTVRALSAGFAAAAARRGFVLNEGFSGFSPFRPDRDAGADMARYLTSLGRRPLVMCHPGRPDPADRADEIAPARASELDYLSSPRFGDLLAERAIRLVPRPG